jgi:hypothetical protein
LLLQLISINSFLQPGHRRPGPKSAKKQSIITAEKLPMVVYRPIEEALCGCCGMNLIHHGRAGSAHAASGGGGLACGIKIAAGNRFFAPMHLELV